MALKVGFVGLGTMGVGMARNLAKAGFSLALASRTASKVKSLSAELNAEACESPRTSPWRRRRRVPPAGRTRGRGGPSRSARHDRAAVPDGPDRQLDDRPEAARSIAARARRPARFLDAPVSGGQKGANEGR
jgi:3-hydroxyisobutyrate dehydrogenase